jgi:hypothetical protein
VASPNAALLALSNTTHVSTVTTSQGTLGSTSGLTGAAECTDCAAGSYCAAASTSGTVCPPGTYSGPKAATCIVCSGTLLQWNILQTLLHSSAVMQLSFDKPQTRVVCT